MAAEPVPPLYGGDLVADAPAGSLIYWVESMTEVKPLQSGGLLAVCAPIREGWRDEHSRQLAGHHVVIVPSAGWASSYGPVKTRAIARSIGQHAASVKVTPPPPCDGAAADAATYLLTHTIAEFEKWAEEVPAQEPPGRGRKASATAGDTDWEEPVPLDSDPAPPTFPTAVQPEWVRDMVEAAAEALQVPPDLPGALALAVLATAAAGPVHIEAAPDWQEPLNLYVSVAMEPGERKSGTFREMTAPMAAYERLELARMAPEIAQAASRRRQAEKKVDRLEKAAASAPDPVKAQKLVGAAAGAVEERDQIVVPHEPQRITADVTPEKLSTLLFQHDGRFAVLSPEGGIFDLMAGLYSKGQPNPDVFLKAHAGDTIRVDRGSRPSEYVEHPALTLGLTPQPASLAAVRKNPALRDRGLLERLLIAVPLGRAGRRKIHPEPIPTAVRERYTAQLQTLARSIDGLDPDPRLTIKLDPRAAAALDAFRTAHEPRCGPDGDLASIKGWANKLPGAAVRIAGLLHLAEHLSDGFGRPIDGATMGGALEVAAYFTAHALRAFGLMDADSRRPDAEAVLAWAQRQNVPEFTRRDAYRGLRRHFSEIAPLTAACELLAQHGYLRPLEEERRPGRPSPAYEVHPSVLAAEAPAAAP
jgi:replicative DNA helicase